MPHKPLESIATDPKRRFLCRHIFTDGHRCGSPALRGESLCYYHIRTRRQGSSAGRSGTFVLPHADDRTSIQLAIADVLCRLAAGDIDLKRGGMLLYGLQVASTNLGRQSAAQAAAQPQVDDFTEDYHLGDLAPIAEVPATQESAQSVPAPAEPSAQPESAHVPASGYPDLGSPMLRHGVSSGLSPALEEGALAPGESTEPDHPELAPADPSTHLPRPTSSELLHRREPAFVHNSAHKSCRLYPAIREELIFTPTPEELAARPEPELELAISASSAAPSLVPSPQSLAPASNC